MMKFFKKNKTGFSLVELIVVIAILGILAAIVVPRIASQSENARIAADQATLRMVRGAVAMFFAQHGRYPSLPAGGAPGQYAPAVSTHNNFLSLGVAGTDNLRNMLDLGGGPMPEARSGFEFRYNPTTGEVTLVPR